MTAYPQPAVPSVDTYSNAQAYQPGLDSYRPPLLSSRPYAAEMGGRPGVNLNEARQLYRLIYQSLGERDRFSSLELGHAAAYHAYCSLIRNRPLHGDIELKRENLIGLAIAEASRLNYQTSRDININACTAASEAAARTACRIFTQTLGAFDQEPVSYPTGYTADPYTDHSGYEDFEMVQRPLTPAVRGRSLSRTPRPTFADTAAVIPDMESGYNVNRVPLNASYSGALAGPRYPPTPHPSTNLTTRYPSTPQTLPTHSSTPYTNPGTMVASYPRTAPSNAVLPQVYQAPSYQGSGTTIPPLGGRSAPFSSSQPAYMVPPVQASYANFPQGYPAGQPEQTIVIHQPKKHRHRRHHRHRHHSLGR